MISMVDYVLAQSTFGTLLGNLEHLGFFQFLLPFLLVLAIVYGVLRFALPETLDKSAAALISIVIAFFTMNYSGEVGFQFADFLTTYFGATSIVLAGILGIVIILGLAGIKVVDIFKVTSNDKIPKHIWVFFVLLAFIGYLVFLGAGGAQLVPIPSQVGGFSNDEFTAIIFFVVILAVAVWFLGRKEEGGETKSATK